MLNEFNKKCKEKEVTKSEVLRECIRKFLEKKWFKKMEIVAVICLMVLIAVIYFGVAKYVL